MKKLSLIVATFNSARYLGETLESISGFLTDDCELIFVDGGSTDETLSLIEAFGRGAILHKQSSRGIYGALNEGVSLASAPWVTFLHSDDVWICPPSLAEISASTTQEVLVGDVSFFKVTNKLLYRRTLGWFPKSALKTFPFIFHPNAIYPRRLLSEHPYDDVRHGRRADMYQIARLGPLVRFRRANAFQYGFRIHAGSTTVAGVKNPGERLSFWFWRVYVFLFWENNRFTRMANLLAGRRVWR